MALILCIETATTVCSVALAKDGKLIASREINEGYSHSENLTVFADEVLKEAKLKPADLNAVCVSKGPGSYTGLRIGVSAAKGFCYALEIPLISINTMCVLFEKIAMSRLVKMDDSKQLFCPMIDARRMEVYCTVFDVTRKEIKPTAAEIITENSFSDLFVDNTIYFFGDGAAKCKSIITHPNAVFIENFTPSAVFMILEAENKFQQKQFEDVAYFEPFYLKEFIGTKKKD